VGHVNVTMVWVCVLPTNCYACCLSSHFVNDVIKLMMHEFKLQFLSTYQ